MIDWPESLVRELADGRAIVFVGSGISKNALPTMPTWGQLLENLSQGLAKKVDQELVSKLVRKDKLLDAAQIITDGIVRADLNAELRRVFQIRPPPHSELYNTLLQFDLKTVVTTNYDEFLEKNFDHFSGGVAAYNVLKHTSRDLLDQLRSPQRTIIKMHGCITEVNDLILDRMSYFSARHTNHGFFATLSALMMTNTILFVGYSLSDPDLQIILENIHGPTNSAHGHYCLLPKLEHRSMVGAIKGSYNIKCIEYPPGEHQMVRGGLLSLLNLVQSSRASRGLM